MKKFLTAWAALAIIAALSPAGAKVPPPFTSGLYESYSPILMVPVGPIDRATASRKLPRWLEVRVASAALTIDFMPEKRVRWVMTYGAHGPIRKVTEVDGQMWTESAFTYDAEGHLAAKRVSGPGLAQPIDEIVTTDTKGRRTARRDRVSGELRWSVKYGARGAVATSWRGKVIERRDRFDAQGRILSTTFGGGAKPVMELVYTRGAGGALARVRWRLGGRRGAAMPLRRDPKVGPIHLRMLRHVAIERHEALMLLGQPDRHSDDDRGAKRRTEDDYSPECWLNEPSSLRYDPSGLSVGTSQGCICGFCVDAALTLDATSIDGVDTHWTAGPWIRLDDAVDVTADHRIMTPSGPRPVGELQAGVAVLGASGEVRFLRSVRRLPLGRARPGRNVRTEAGYFGAGGFLFESEQALFCPTIMVRSKH